MAYLIMTDVVAILEPTENDWGYQGNTPKNMKKMRCVVEILFYNSLYERLYDLFHPIKSQQDIWKALEHKYTAMNKEQTDFLEWNFLNFKWLIKNCNERSR